MTVETTRRWRAANPERWAKVNAACQARHRASHPDRVGARQAVHRAVRRGLLTREPCNWCGDPKVEAHHLFGYEREFWLEVLWLCRTCHLREHNTTIPTRDERHMWDINYELALDAAGAE